MNSSIEVGKLLVAEPFMDDPYLISTVILLCENQPKHAMGIVLNRTLKVSLDDLIDDVPPFKAWIGEGGPVEQDALFYLHKNIALPGTLRLGNNLGFGGDFEVLKTLIQTKRILPDHIQFYLGCAAWEQGQLQDEMDEKSWIVAPASVELLFHPERKTLWKRSLVQLGQPYIDLARAPENPMLN